MTVKIFAERDYNMMDEAQEIIDQYHLKSEGEPFFREHYCEGCMNSGGDGYVRLVISVADRCADEVRSKLQAIGFEVEDWANVNQFCKDWVERTHEAYDERAQIMRLQ